MKDRFHHGLNQNTNIEITWPKFRLKFLRMTSILGNALNSVKMVEPLGIVSLN